MNIQTFQDYLKEELRNEKTIQTYTKDVEVFRSFLNEKGVELRYLNEMHIRGFQHYLNEKGYKETSIARQFSTLRKYCRYLRKNGLITTHPMEDVQIKLKKKEKVSISDEHVEEVVYELIEKEKMREAILLSLLHYEQLTIEEIKGMKWSLESIQNEILYSEKRAVRLNELTKDLFLLWHEKYNDLNVFVNQHGKEMATSGLYYIFKQSIEKSALEGVSPQSLRKK